jgi:KRAB domain-containing zinc finger protein
MTRHMKSHTGERNYSCSICDKKFLYSYNVIAHVNYVHKGMRYKVDESKLICNICGKKFQKQKKVKEHMAEVHNVGEVIEGDLIVEDAEEGVVEWIENYS